MARPTDTGDAPEATRVSRGTPGAISASPNTIGRLAFRWEGLLVVLILAVTLLNSRLSPFFLNGSSQCQRV